jgi:hypothetical protein
MLITVALILLYILYQWDSYVNLLALMAIINKTYFKDNTVLPRFILAILIAIIFGYIFSH